MIKVYNLNKYLSTLNFILIFVGYQLVTSLFLPGSSDIEGISRKITIPYRAMALLVSASVIFININKKNGKLPKVLFVFWIYWIALVIRIFHDTSIRSDVHLNGNNQLWLYIFGIVIPSMYSVMVSYKKIDLNKALKWIYFGIIVTLLLSLFNNSNLLKDANEINERAGGNLALNSISFGHLGTSGILLSLYFLLEEKNQKLFKKAIFVAVLLFSFFIMLRAGSRSPLMALLIILAFWQLARNKSITIGIIIAGLITIFLILSIEPILNFIGNISPIIETRLKMSLYEGDSGGRDILYNEAFEIFLKYPILGKQFALFNMYGGFTYSHNIILDSLIALGILGGLAIIYVISSAFYYSYKLIKIGDPNYWICIILIQQIIMSMFSGAIYYSQLLNSLLVFLFLYYKVLSSIKRKSLFNAEYSHYQ